MKKSIIILIVAFVISFIACNQNTGKPVNEIEAAIAREMESGLRIDTVFLGYTFGMTEQQIRDHTTSLIDSKKLTYNWRKQNFEYRFYFADPSVIDSAYANIGFDFHEGKMYRLNLFVKPYTDIFSTNTLLLYDVLRVFIEKYTYNYIETKSTISDDKTFTWVNGNLKVEIFEGFDDVRVFYTDIPAKRNMDEVTRAQSIERSKKNLTDI